MMAGMAWVVSVIPTGRVREGDVQLPERKKVRVSEMVSKALSYAITYYRTPHMYKRNIYIIERQ